MRAEQHRDFNLGATEQARNLFTALGFQSYPAEIRRWVAPGEYAKLVLAEDALLGLRELAAGHVLSESHLTKRSRATFRIAGRRKAARRPASERTVEWVSNSHVYS